MKGIYLGAYKAVHPDHDIVYQDINGKRDLSGDMMDIDLSPYDYIICTPPCNYWSRASIKHSEYAMKTMHLLPEMLKKLYSLDKPFIVENVRNKKRFDEFGLFDYPLFVNFIGRHTYWSNIWFPVNDLVQVEEYHSGKRHAPQNQGGENVYYVIERFIKYAENLYVR